MGRPKFGAVESRAMPSEVVSCPYCNTAAAVPAGARPGQRIPCPRCGESFPYRGPAADGAGAAAPPPADVPPPAPPASRRFTNGQIALFILGAMTAMALLGLAYALHTQAIRRSYDVRLPKTRAIDVPLFARVALGVYVAGLVGAIVWGWNRRERAAGVGAARPWARRVGVPGLAILALIGIGLALVAIPGRPARQPLEIEKPSVPAVAPADLAALGYLPDDTELIAAAHVAEAQDNPVGRDLLWRVGLGGAGAPAVARWTGLGLDDIDHVALGLKLDADLPLSEVLVIRARRPLDAPRVRDALKAKSPEEVAGRTVYPFVLETGLPVLASLNLAAWFADERTLVLAKKERFERVPREPKTGIDHLRPALREVLKERMAPAAQVWTAGHIDSWDGLNFFLRLWLGDKLEGADAVKKLRTLAVWFTADRGGVTLGGTFNCADEEAARALADYLGPKERQGLRELFAAPEEGNLGREMLDSLKTTRHATWVDVQAKASAEAVHGKQ